MFVYRCGCVLVFSALETEVTPLAKSGYSRTWLERPLASDDGSQPERHLVDEERSREQLEETFSLFLHQQQPALSTVSVSSLEFCTCV